MNTIIKPNSPILLASLLGEVERHKSFPTMSEITNQDLVSFFDASDFSKNHQLEFERNLTSWASGNEDAQFLFFLAHGNEAGLGLPDRKFLAFEHLFDIMVDAVRLIPELSGVNQHGVEIEDLNDDGSHLDLILLSCRASPVSADFNKISSLGYSIPSKGIVGFAEKLSMGDVERIFNYFLSLVVKPIYNFREVYVSWFVANVGRSSPRGFILDSESGLLKAFNSP